MFIFLTRSKSLIFVFSTCFTTISLFLDCDRRTDVFEQEILPIGKVLFYNTNLNLKKKKLFVIFINAKIY